jgi:hypothetical protein
VHPPKALAIKVLLAAFWLFSAVTVSTYQANLSAYLTVSSLSGNNVPSVQSLASQLELEYTTISKTFFI